MELFNLALSDRAGFKRRPHGPIRHDGKPDAQTSTNDGCDGQTHLANRKRDDCEYGKETGNARVYA